MLGQRVLATSASLPGGTFLGTREGWEVEAEHLPESGWTLPYHHHPHPHPEVRLPECLSRATLFLSSPFSTQATDKDFQQPTPHVSTGTLGALSFGTPMEEVYTGTISQEPVWDP